MTLPLHAPSGKIIATASMNEASRTKESVVQEAMKMAAELEKGWPSLDELFRGKLGHPSYLAAP